MSRSPRLATISELEDRTAEDRASGAMRSVQAANVTLPQLELDKLWTPMHLERLARTYWRFITRVTFGLVRVLYSESERSVVLLGRPLKLLTFEAPEYEMDDEHALVRWRIKRGLLVAKSGHGGHGHLQIDVRKLPSTTPQEARLHIEVEVANFHPAIASRLGQRVYNATQARLHLFVTNGFLHSLARLDLAESRVGRFSRSARPRQAPVASRDRELPSPAAQSLNGSASPEIRWWRRRRSGSAHPAGRRRR